MTRRTFLKALSGVMAIPALLLTGRSESVPRFTGHVKITSSAFPVTSAGRWSNKPCYPEPLTPCSLQKAIAALKEQEAAKFYNVGT